MALALLAVVLSGCEQPPTEPPVERSRTYALAEEAVRDHVLAFLKANDIAIESGGAAGGVIQARRVRYQDAGWARCEPAVVNDRSSDSARPRRARVFLDRDLALEVDLRDSGGMVEVTLAAPFSERQIDPHRNLPIQVPCGSTGVLEKALLDAI